MVELCRIEDEDDTQTVMGLLRNHHQFTESPVAKRILDNWAKESKHFVKVMPRDFRRVLEQRRQLKAGAGLIEKGSGVTAAKHAPEK
jgi:glutamate synthase domain-containing protein 3